MTDGQTTKAKVRTKTHGWACQVWVQLVGQTLPFCKSLKRERNRGCEWKGQQFQNRHIIHKLIGHLKGTPSKDTSWLESRKCPNIFICSLWCNQHFCHIHKPYPWCRRYQAKWPHSQQIVYNFQALICNTPNQKLTEMLLWSTVFFIPPDGAHGASSPGVPFKQSIWLSVLYRSTTHSVMPIMQ